MRAVEQVFHGKFHYDYYFDNQLFPYSEKPDELLISQLVPTLKHAVKRLQADCLVIACNTASTLILDQLRAVVKIPVVGVIPAVKPAVEYLVRKQRTHQYVGVVATKATVSRPYLKQLIADFGEGVDYRVKLLGSTDLVNLAEAQLRGQEYTGPSLEQIFIDWLEFNRNHPETELGAIVLACTHFPLLKSEIHQLFPQAQLIDSGFAIARRVGWLMGIFKQVEIEAQRQEFLRYIHKHKSPKFKTAKRLFGTRGISKAEFKSLQAEGFTSFKLLEHVKIS